MTQSSDGPIRDWKIAVALTIALRIFYSAFAALLAVVRQPDPALIRSNVLTENLPAPGSMYYALLGIWQRFDTLWYLRIAERGYDSPAAVVFHPLYPALIRALTPVTGGLAASLLISTIASGFLFAGMMRLTRMEFPDRTPARAVLLVGAWPTSFIFFAGYTDSLAIALVVWCIVLGRTKCWFLAATLACAAGLTRSMGALLIVPLAVMAWRDRKISVWPIFFAPFGTLAYWTWLHFTGRLSVIQSYREVWTTRVAPPWTTLWHAAHTVVSHPDVLLGLSLAALAIFAVTGLRSRRRLEDRAFALGVMTHVLLRLCHPSLLGTPRYLLPMYPSFLTMSEWIQRLERRRFAFICLALFIFNLAWLYAFLNWSLVV